MTYRLHASLGYHLSLAARIQEGRLDDGLRPLGLTRTTWCVLLAIGNEGLEHPSDIASFVGIDRTATSRALRHMEADGLIVRRGGNADGRTTSVTITALGRQRLAEGTLAATANNAAMAEKLSAGEVETLKALLVRLTAGAAAIRKL